MIVHNVKIGKKTSEYLSIRENKKIYVGSAESDIRYRDMLVNGRHRWELYSKPSIDFFTFDRKGMELSQCKPIVEKKIRGVDGVMIIVSDQMSSDPLVLWEIDCSVANKIPLVGVDIGKNTYNLIPKGLERKITKFGWEWFSEFIDGL
ncbi:hypothetical protein [Desulfotignum balticum]|uniref:hypothetical protein n=1 Tax=Desulfotignum balticum TaxID=115781 RepID=UPI0004628164|nr:hypothetical protein [Desulfotignum balticum]